jgi:hypothetical protein
MSTKTLEKLKSLYPNWGFNASKSTRKDKYIHAYWGKDYGGEPLEVLTMAFQTVIAGEDFGELFLNDREMLDFVVGLLFHWKP